MRWLGLRLKACYKHRQNLWAVWLGHVQRLPASCRNNRQVILFRGKRNGGLDLLKTAGSMIVQNGNVKALPTQTGFLFRAGQHDIHMSLNTIIRVSTHMSNQVLALTPLSTGKYVQG